MDKIVLIDKTKDTGRYTTLIYKDAAAVMTLDLADLEFFDRRARLLRHGVLHLRSTQTSEEGNMKHATKVTVSKADYGKRGELSNSSIDGRRIVLPRSSLLLELY